MLELSVVIICSNKFHRNQLGLKYEFPSLLFCGLDWQMPFEHHVVNKKITVFVGNRNGYCCINILADVRIISTVSTR